MVKPINNPKNATEWKQEAERIRDGLLAKGTPTTPTPTELKTEKDWVQFDGTNMLNFKPEGHELEDVPHESAFKKAGVKFYKKVKGYLYFMIKSAKESVKN